MVMTSTILLDAPQDEETAFDTSMLERFGHPVSVCEGPEFKHICPLLGGAGCPTFEQAHGIVFKLDLERAQHRAILRAYRELAPDVPIRVVVRPGQAEHFHELLAGFSVWAHEPTVADLDALAAEIEAADTLL